MNPNQRGAQRHAAGGHQQAQAEIAHAADDQGTETENQQEHQAGHGREAEQHAGRAGVQGIEEQQGEVGLLRIVALETAAEIVRQMRVEQGVGHHPQNVVGEVPDIGAGGDAGGRGDIGQYARIVFAQRRRR